MGQEKDIFSRRDFVLGATATVGGLVAAPALAAPASSASGRKVIHIIGHSHIDAAWLWPWRDGADAVLNTFRSALNRMKENSQFHYSHSSSMHYRWVQRADPALFAEVKQRIQEGRWEVVGGWPVEPDCNIPAAESFVRHALYGKHFCRQELGADVKIGFNPDSFGHAAGLPILLHRAGYDCYVFMRPQGKEMAIPLPRLFWWEGADGSRVLALHIYRSYDSSARDIPRDMDHLFAPGMNDAAFFLGVGDHGGAVTAEQVRQVVAMQKDTSLPELRFSTLKNFFDAVRQSPAFASLPVIKNELQHHSRGCYSTHAKGKYNNRRAERWLVEAESISAIANASAGHPYPTREYAESWWKVTFCQFHDMMAGTSLYADYEDVRDSLGYACEVALTSRVEALQTMAKRVDTSNVKESAVFLYNPLPWPRKARVEFHTRENPDHLGEITNLKAEDGSRIPIQFRPSDSMTEWFPRLTTWVDLPASGYKVFELGHGPMPQYGSSPNPTVSDWMVGYDAFGTNVALPYTKSARVSDTGFGISSLKAEDGRELLAGSIGLVVISDTSDTWSHGVREFRQEMGRPKLLSTAVVENGPVTRVTRHRAGWRNSEIIMDIAQFAGQNVVELRFVINWREHQQILKLEIPTALGQPSVFAKVPGQVIERAVDGQEQPYQDWAAVEGKIGGSDYSLALLNNCTYSYDCLNGLFRTILIRSAPFARHEPNPVTYFDNRAWQDQGRQERHFWLAVHNGGYTGMNLDRLAEEVQTPAEYVVDSAHAGAEPWQNSFLEIQPANVWVMAVKRAEDGSGAILRIQERAGKPTTASVKSSLLGLNQSVSLSPWEIKTLLVQKKAGSQSTVREVSLLEV